MRSAQALSVSLAVIVVVTGAVLYQANVAGQHPQPPGSGPAAVFLDWPLPATGQAYAAIDGKHLWQYVRAKGDTAERYRDQGHPQFWGIIAGTSGDAEDAQWMLTQYQRIGLAETRIQPVAFFHPQWEAQSWEVDDHGRRQGRVADVGAAGVRDAVDRWQGPGPGGRLRGLGSEADFAGRDVRGKAVVVFKDGGRGSDDGVAPRPGPGGGGRLQRGHPGRQLQLPVLPGEYDHSDLPSRDRRTA